MGTNYIDSLLASIENESVRERLTKEVNKLRDNKEFGLVFERHIPEYVRLPQHKITEGATVQIRAGKGDEIYVVRSIEKKKATIIDSNGEAETMATKDLIIVSRHGEPIFPGLTEVDRVERGGNKPFHTVINAENYHALQLLLYTHGGKVDCIYIDPPYNTGEGNWKYNNDYVDREDRFMHSKWLSFMEKRLKLAKRLLNTKKSALIVTIDENEVHTLGLLLEQLFPRAKRQLISIVINTQGSAKKHLMSRVAEYAFIVCIGEMEVQSTSVDSLPTDDSQSQKGKERIWYSLIRGGNSGKREKSYASFFPIFIENSTGRIAGTGNPLPKNQNPEDLPPPPNNQSRILPIGSKGEQGRWQMTLPEFEKRLAAGHIRVGKQKKDGSWPITYLREGMVKKIEEGELRITGRDHNNALILENVDRSKIPKTVWYVKSHNSGTYGRSLLLDFVDTEFDFPKSLYSVEDILRAFVLDNKNALIVDFFGGSGTTAHATFRLNKQDEGRRKCILVTNNELSKEESKELTNRGIQDGDSEWIEAGIFHSVTMPRLKAAISGVDSSGESLSGDYTFIDEFPYSEGFEENVLFYGLEHAQIDSISRNKSFGKIAPLLWMISGSVGSVIEEVSETFELQPEGRYGILYDLTHWQEFVDAVKEVPTMTHVFIITDSKVQYQQIVNHLTTNIHATMLYEDYLRNFQIGV